MMFPMKFPMKIALPGFRTFMTTLQKSATFQEIAKNFKLSEVDFRQPRYDSWNKTKSCTSWSRRGKENLSLLVQYININININALLVNMQVT